MGTYKGFTSVELRRPKRSTFDLSHEKRISGRMGRLTPVFISETLPNDSFRVSTEVLIKLAPMIAPIFHRLNMYVHFFFIPNRLLWGEWETFITGGRLGEEVATPPVPPRLDVETACLLTANILDVGSLADYLGINPIPDTAANDWTLRTIDAMPFAACRKVYMDYYRDRNYTDDDALLPLQSGTQVISGGNYEKLLSIKQRAWQHDYYTSALLFTQRGAEVLMPMEGSGSVEYMPISEFYDSVTNDPAGVGSISSVDLGSGDGVLGVPVPGAVTAPPWTPGRVENIDSVTFTNSTISINDLRRAARLQEWLERNALAGSRYNESIMAHFGRKTSDSRLQRAEYLGGGKAVIQISEVMTTAYSEDAAAEVVPPANPSGRGSAYSTVNGFSYNCEEHGFVVGFLSVMPSSAYFQGMPRMFHKRDTFLDYPWPSFAHLGEQEVYDWEIFSDPSTVPQVGGGDGPLFGYQSRYSDWKNISSSSHGDFRTTLDFWHLSRKFAGGAPNLSQEFVEFEDGLQDRVFNVSGVDTLWMYVYNKCTVNRALPYFGTPQL